MEGGVAVVAAAVVPLAEAEEEEPLTLARRCKSRGIEEAEAEEGEWVIFVTDLE